MPKQGSITLKVYHLHQNIEYQSSYFLEISSPERSTREFEMQNIVAFIDWFIFSNCLTHTSFSFPQNKNFSQNQELIYMRYYIRLFCFSLTHCSAHNTPSLNTWIKLDVDIDDFLLHWAASVLPWSLCPSLACYSYLLAKNVTPCKRLLLSKYLSEKKYALSKVLNMVFHEAYYSALYFIITYWGVIVLPVMEVKFIFLSPD